MARLHQKLALQSYRERQQRKAGKVLSLRSPDFKVQNDCLDAVKDRFKAINCTRRAGKSVGEAKSHIECAMKYPKSRQLYMGLTLDSVSEIIWDVFKDETELAQIRCKFNETKKIILFPNGSRIRLFGLDSSRREMRKVLGQKLRKVSIDEAGSITTDLKKICYQMIRPTLIDLAPLSWLTLLGTCENIPNTFFEQVTEGREPGWKVFKWTASDNPYLKIQWEREIKDILKLNPAAKEASWFKTHYLNIWCADDDLIIMPIDVTRDFISELPKGKYQFILGVDLGYKDATSFVVVAYSFDDPVCYIVESQKETEMDFTDVAKTIKAFNKRYPFDKLIVDGANKQGVQEMRKRHDLPLHNAEKADKATFLRMFKDDFVQERVKIIEGANNELHTEWKSLLWKNSDRDEEDGRCQNHLSDAALYAWRECKHYIYEPPAKAEDRDSEEYMDAEEEKESEKLIDEESQQWWEQKIAA